MPDGLGIQLEIAPDSVKRYSRPDFYLVSVSGYKIGQHGPSSEHDGTYLCRIVFQSEVPVTRGSFGEIRNFT